MRNIVCYGTYLANDNHIIAKSKTGNYDISLSECARNSRIEHEFQAATCVATRDITTLTFTFFTEPQTNIVFGKRFWGTFLFGKSASSRFLALQNQIVQSGYSSYDMS